MTGVAHDPIRGAYKLKDRLLLILDTEKTVRLLDVTLGKEMEH